MPMTDLPDILAIFPLPGAILLPRARLPLHIFEPRYLAMIDDALKTDHRLIGMVQPSGDHLHHVGCAGRITALNETDDGRYMITLSGVSRFSIQTEVAGFQPYRRARMDWAAWATDRAPCKGDPGLDRDALLVELERYLRARHLGMEAESLRNVEDETMINALAMICPFPPEEKQALLEARDLSARREVLEALMRFAAATGGASGGEGEVLQ